MLKTIRDFAVGAFVAAAIGAAVAATGTAPLSTGFQVIDGAWLAGLAGGTNLSYQYGITAHAGGGQTACLNLVPNTALYEVDTVASGGDSICVPYALAGSELKIRNAGANSMNVYAQSGTNLATAATDTINGSSNSTAYAVSSNTNAICFAAKNGVWNCIKGS